MERLRVSKQRGEFWKGVIALLALIMVFFFSKGFQNYARGVFVSVFSPRAGAAGEYASFSRDALIARVTEDEKQISSLKYQALLYGTLAEENARLRHAAGAISVPGRVTARVLARPPETHYDTLLIDTGRNAGITEGDIAVSEGVLLGKVVSLDATSATVQLFSSSGSERDVTLGNPVAVAVARGVGGGSFELSIPQGVKIVSGDLVHVSSTESMILGVVTSVSAEARDASQKVHFRAPVSFADLDFISVIPNGR